MDRFHAKKRFWDVAREVYGKVSDIGAAWDHARCSELETEQFSTLQAALQVHADTHPEAKAAIGRFRDNVHRMRYKQFRQQGPMVASGVVESGRKQVVGVRLKGSGRRWSVVGGSAIVALRSCILSGRFEDFTSGHTVPTPLPV